jgi:ATP-dependent DNA helicase RecQ
MTSDRCRRRQLLDHFGDRTPGAPSGRCCDVCDPDPSLELAAVEVAAGRARGARRRAPAAPAAGSASPGAGGAPAATAAPVDERALERLKAWRLGRAEGKPAYTVASNAALEEVLRRRPRDQRGLLAVRGIGPGFWARHGPSLLAELAAID